MPLDYRIDQSRRLVVTTAEGILSKYELLNHQARVLNDPEFDPTFSQLHDMRGADFPEVYEDCVEALARCAVSKGGTRIAIVVRDAIGKDLARMFAGLREGTGEEIRVFRDLDSANSWLEPIRERPVGGRVLDRRVAPRVSADLHPSVPGRANFIAGDVEGSGQILNVSTSGAFVAEPSHHLEAGTEVDLYFLEPKTGRRLHASGRVVRGEDSGFAVHFTRVERELLGLVLVAAGKAKDRK